MFQAHVTGHLCDFADFGIDESLDAIQGIGATGVTVTVMSDPRSVLRSRGGEGARLFRSSGGFFFQPDADFYADTHLKPITSTWLRQRNPLDKLVDGCRERHLDLRLRINALELGRIAAKHPEAAGKTAFGDVSPDTLCPANPDVRALIRGAVRDLASRYAPNAIELDGIRYHSGALTALPGLVIGMDTGDGFLALLSTCFSESSLQTAAERGVDAAAAMHWTRAALDRSLTSGVAEEWDLEEVLEQDDALRPYIDCQQEIIDAWLGDLINQAGVGLIVVLPGEPNTGAVPSVGAMTRVAGMVAEADIPDPTQVPSYLSTLREEFGTATPLVVDLDVTSDLGEHPQEIVAIVMALAENGAGGVAFSDFGLIPPKRFTALKQAIRYAGRSAP